MPPQTEGPESCRPDPEKRVSHKKPSWFLICPKFKHLPSKRKTNQFINCEVSATQKANNVRNSAYPRAPKAAPVRFHEKTMRGLLRQPPAYFSGCLLKKRSVPGYIRDSAQTHTNKQTNKHMMLTCRPWFDQSAKQTTAKFMCACRGPPTCPAFSVRFGQLALGCVTKPKTWENRNKN